MISSVERGHSGTRPKVDLIAGVCLGVLAAVTLGFAAFTRSIYVSVAGGNLAVAAFALCSSYRREGGFGARRPDDARSERRRRVDRILARMAAVGCCLLALYHVLHEQVLHLLFPDLP